MSKGHERLSRARVHSLGTWQEGHAHEKERQSLAGGTLDVDQAFDVHLCLWEYHLYGDQGSAGIRTAVDQTLEQARRMKAPRARSRCARASPARSTSVRADGTRPTRSSAARSKAFGWSEARAARRCRSRGSQFSSRLVASLEEGRRLLDEGLVVGGRAAMRSHCLTRMLASLARNRLAAGDHDGARASLEEGLAEADVTGTARRATVCSCRKPCVSRSHPATSALPRGTHERSTTSPVVLVAAHGPRWPSTHADASRRTW